jgi:hypothetical protein
MRPRAEVALALGALALLGVGAGLLGTRRSRVPDQDVRRSTYLAGPRGARAYAEALGRLGVTVTRLRRRSASLASAQPAPGRLYAVLDPSYALDAADGARIAAYRARGGDVLLAGRGAAAAMACFGFAVRRRPDSAAVTVPAVSTGGGLVWTRLVLIQAAAEPRDSLDALFHPCPAADPIAAESLLVTRDARAVALRLTFATGGTATLVSDGGLFANEALRRSAAGEFALGLVAGRYRSVVFDEYHHGFGPQGSLARAVVAWSAGSPWGWAIWQVVVVALLALGAAAVRFGPARTVADRRRRSSLEHVRALATALAAARGHDVAVRLLVQGLRRRLAPGRPLRADLAGWLETMAPHLRSERARADAAELRRLISRPQSADGVLRAATTVEDLWQELKPS